MARQSLDGERINVMLTNRQLARLEKLTKASGVLRSELIRRAVDAFLAKVDARVAKPKK